MGSNCQKIPFTSHLVSPNDYILPNFGSISKTRILTLVTICHMGKLHKH